MSASGQGDRDFADGAESRENEPGLSELLQNNHKSPYKEAARNWCSEDRSEITEAEAGAMCSKGHHWKGHEMDACVAPPQGASPVGTRCERCMLASDSCRLDRERTRTCGSSRPGGGDLSEQRWGTQSTHVLARGGGEKTVSQYHHERGLDPWGPPSKL